MSMVLKLVVFISILGLVGTLFAVGDMNEPNKSEPNNMSSDSYGYMSGSSLTSTTDPNNGGCVPRRDANEPNKS